MTCAVRGSKRGGRDIDRASAAGKRAAERLAQSALRTGGMRAVTPDDAGAHIEVFCKEFGALYSDSVRRALLGARRVRIASRHQRRAADVNSLVEAVRLFRAYLISQGGAIGLTVRAKSDMLADIMLPTTAFDARVVVFLGHCGKRCVLFVAFSNY